MKFFNLIAVGILSCSSLCLAGQKNTANYVQSSIDKYDGTEAKIDITHLVRINLSLPDSDVALFTAHTIDDRSLTYGGHILLIADNSVVPDLIAKYGTSVDNSRRLAASKSLRGTVGRIKTEGMEDIVFINISSDSNPEKLPIKRVSADAVVNPEKASN